MAGFIQPHLIQAHASLIGAPSARRYDPFDEQIKQEQLRGLRIRNDQASIAPSAVVRTTGGVVNHPSSYFKEPDRVKIWNEPTHAGGSWNPHEESAVVQRQKKRPVSQTSSTPQEQLAQLQLQKLRRDLENDQVVESTERFGKHSPDAQWDPTNGGRWVRSYRPGEREAMAAEQTGAVKDYFDALSGQRTHENKLSEDLAQNENEAKRYAINKITDQNAKPQTPIRRQFGELLSSALDKIRNRGKESYGDDTIDASFMKDYNFGVQGNPSGAQSDVETADDYDEDNFDTAAGIF